MTLRKALLAATVLALPVAASAQPIDGLYISGGLGANMITSTDVKVAGIKGTASTPHAGIDGFASIGYGYANGVRAEAEVFGLEGSAKVKLNGVRGAGGIQTTMYGLMFNGLYDFSGFSGFTPYVGAGVGYVGQQLSSPIKSGALGSFAAQGIVGVAVPVAPQLALTVDYRLIDKLQSRTYGSSAGVETRVGSMLDHSLNLGLRYAFGAAPAPVAAPAPAPAAMVAPAPAPARSYLVFFDWDKADLTARAQQIIAEAAKNATRVASTRIDVAGHADKTGTAAYNQTLSLARANNVAAELVRLGVAKSAISITAYGDTKPLVPTAEGVREPQNRRVEIVLK